MSPEHATSHAFSLSVHISCRVFGPPPSISVSALLWHQDGGSGRVVMGDVPLHLPPLSLAHLTLYRRPPHTASRTPPPHTHTHTILTTLAPHSIHKPEMISVLPLCVGQDKTMAHCTTEHHPSRRSSIWDTKDEMLLELPFAKRVSLCLDETLVLHLCCSFSQFG